MEDCSSSLVVSSSSTVDCSSSLVVSVPRSSTALLVGGLELPVGCLDLVLQLPKSSVREVQRDADDEPPLTEQNVDVRIHRVRPGCGNTAFPAALPNGRSPRRRQVEARPGDRKFRGLKTKCRPTSRSASRRARRRAD